MRKKPLIGITCNFDNSGRVGFVDGMGEVGQTWSYLYSDYIDFVKKAGGIPLIIPIFEDVPAALELLDELDGVLISGGNDISPLLYQERISYAGKLSFERDEQDFAIIQHAVEKKIPIFGICRGLQALNVYFGGTLHQDLAQKGFLPHSMDNIASRNQPTHTVQLSENSLLRKTLKKEQLWVNSYHHSAIHQTAAAFEISAVSEDGIVEGIELVGDSFIAAVQWHPEMMFDSAEQLALLAPFIDAAAAYLKQRSAAFV